MADSKKEISFITKALTDVNFTGIDEGSFYNGVIWGFIFASKFSKKTGRPLNPNFENAVKDLELDKIPSLQSILNLTFEGIE